MAVVMAVVARAAATAAAATVAAATVGVEAMAVVVTAMAVVVTAVEEDNACVGYVNEGHGDAGSDGDVIPGTCCCTCTRRSEERGGRASWNRWRM